MIRADIHSYHFHELDSTNSYALEQLDELQHHSLIISDVQLAGRGRLERTWDSSIQGNLYMSLVEKNLGNNVNLANLTQLMAVAVCAAGGKRGYKLRIKWPNDLMLDEGKAGGILSETRFRASEFLGMVIGVGINITGVPRLAGDSPYSPVCLASCEGYENKDSGNRKRDCPDLPARDEFAEEVLNEYMKRYPEFLNKGFMSIADEYRNGLSEYSRPVFIEADGFREKHDFLGINDQGEIIVRTPMGDELCIQAGDVR